MNRESSIRKLEKRIGQIKSEITAFDELRPGSIGEQYNVCGSPNCRCKDRKNPQKHGPYYQLSYTWEGKSRTEFVRKQDIELTRAFVDNYKCFMALRDEWINCSIQLSKLRKQK